MSESWLSVDDPLVKSLIVELRRRVEPLIAAGVDLRHFDVTLHGEGKHITSDIFISGGGYSVNQGAANASHIPPVGVQSHQ